MEVAPFLCGLLSRYTATWAGYPGD